MSIRNSVLAGVSIVMLLGGCGNGSASSSPLIGDWKLSSNSSDTCSIDRVTFSPKSYTEHIISIGPHPAYETSGVVTYDWEAPNKAIVNGQGTGAGSEIWIMQDNNHAYPTDLDRCYYERAK